MPGVSTTTLGSTPSRGGAIDVSSLDSSAKK